MLQYTYSTSLLAYKTQIDVEILCPSLQEVIHISLESLNNMHVHDLNEELRRLIAGAQNKS